MTTDYRAERAADALDPGVEEVVPLSTIALVQVWAARCEHSMGVGVEFKPEEERGA